MSEIPDQLRKAAKRLDKGCDASRSCLKCKLRRCKRLDLIINPDRQREIRNWMIGILHCEGVGRFRIASKCGVSYKTVDRVTRRLMLAILKAQEQSGHG